MKNFKRRNTNVIKFVKNFIEYFYSRMEKTFFLIYSLNNWSPLDQFDDMSWTLYNSVFESTKTFGLYTFELEYDMFTLWSRNGAFVSYFGHGSALFFVVLLIALGYTLSQYNFLQDFSVLFLIGFIHLATVSAVFFWFDDFVFSSVTGTKDVFSLSNISSSFDFVNGSYVLGEVQTHFIPQINLAVVFDENFITFLAVFFLLGGSEEEEDENFILEEEESDFIEDIVAPIFISNFGKNVEDNGALFLKLNTVFAFVLFNNIVGMIPYSNTGTSSLILTFWVALSVFGSLLYLLIRKHGVNYFFSLFMPSGVPVPLLLLLIPIEFISYVFRLVSLSVRLFANMFAGHTLFKVFIGFSWTMILVGDVFLLINLFPMVILFVLTFLEIGVAVVQAYIFITLTAMYLKDIFVAPH